MRFTYSEKHLTFLREQFPKLSVEMLTVKFNKKFKMDKLPKEIKAALKNHRIRCGRKLGELNKGPRVYTPEIRKFIEKHYKNNSRVVVARLLNEKFNTKFTGQQIASYCKRFKIRSESTGRFTKGSVSWNAGTKGVMKRNSGTFKKGAVPPTVNPYGHERICAKDGYIMVKVDKINPYTGHKGHYIAKHRVIWEQLHGPIPEGKIVTFKDGDIENLDPENLDLIDRGTHAVLNKKQISKVPKEIKPAMRALIKLEVAVGRVGK